MSYIDSIYNKTKALDNILLDFQASDFLHLNFTLKKLKGYEEYIIYAINYTVNYFEILIYSKRMRFIKSIFIYFIKNNFSYKYNKLLNYLFFIYSKSYIINIRKINFI